MDELGIIGYELWAIIGLLFIIVVELAALIGAVMGRR